MLVFEEGTVRANDPLDLKSLKRGAGPHHRYFPRQLSIRRNELADLIGETLVLHPEPDRVDEDATVASPASLIDLPLQHRGYFGLETFEVIRRPEACDNDPEVPTSEIVVECEGVHPSFLPMVRDALHVLVPEPLSHSHCTPMDREW